MRHVPAAACLDRPAHVGHNRRQVKRLGLVLFVCLSVQLNAASGSFLHMHAEEAHETDHHEGTVVHRHLSSHIAADDPHHEDQVTPEIQRADASTSVVASDVAAISIGGLTIRLSATAAPRAPPAAPAELIELPRPAIPPDADVGHRLPDSPQPHSSSHRGPPR